MNQILDINIKFQQRAQIHDILINESILKLL